MGVPTPTQPEDLDEPALTFDAPDLTTFARLEELSLVVVGERLESDRAVLECRVVARDDDAFRRGCGAEGVMRDTVSRRLAHEPFGWRPTMLLVCTPAPAPYFSAANTSSRACWESENRARRGQATWGIYPHMITAYRHPDRTQGRALMTAVIDSVASGVPTALTELVTLGRTLKKRAADVLAAVTASDVPAAV